VKAGSTNIAVNKMVNGFEGNIRDYSGGESVTALERCGGSRSTGNISVASV
jgi:hypothetical protein